MKVGFLGTGNMGGAILRSCAAQGTETILAYRRSQEPLLALCQETGALPCSSVEDLVKNSDVLFLGVKPQTFPAVLPAVATEYTQEKVVVSMAAGVPIEKIQQVLGEQAKILRIMPNTPALVGQGVTAICGNEQVTTEEFQQVCALLQGTGLVQQVPEEQFHAVVALTGSSPAYTYMYMEGLAKEAVRQGMEASAAKRLAIQAVLGAATLAMNSEKSLEQLRIDVCSPGGTTIEAVKVLEDTGFQDLLGKAMEACATRSKELAK